MGKSVIRKKINAKGSHSSGGGGGGAVSSFNGRTGAVVPVAGDYPPIALAYADITTETLAGNLIDGQLYNITGFPVFTSGVQLENIYVFAHLDNTATGSAQALLDYDCVANYSDVGNQSQVSMRYDWYNSQVISISDKFGNVIEGNSKCDNWPWGDGNFINNKFGYNFILDMTIPPTSMTNSIGLGNGTLTTIARVYDNINFDKGYFAFDFLINSTGVPTDNISIDIQKNEIGVVPTPSFITDGEYRIDGALAGCFGSTASKFNVQVAPTDISVTFVSVYVTWTTDVRIDVQFNDITGSGHVASALSNVSVQVKVYF